MAATGNWHDPNTPLTEHKLRWSTNRTIGAINTKYIENAARDAGLGEGLDGHQIRGVINVSRRSIQRLLSTGIPQAEIIAKTVNQLLSIKTEADPESRVWLMTDKAIATFVDWLCPWLIGQLATGDDS